MSKAISVAITASNQYVPRGRNELHTIFERHFADFCEHYDEKYAATYGRYRLERIQQLGERFATCGDYLQGVARIRCTNPECGLVGAFGTSPMHPGHDYFRPFSCKGFYLCPSCSRKRTILFAERLTNEVLLKLPHRQFVFTKDACASKRSLRPGQHIPPKRLQLIRRYGLYASRTKGRWQDMPWVAERAPKAWKAAERTLRAPADMRPILGTSIRAGIQHPRLTLVEGSGLAGPLLSLFHLSAPILLRRDGGRGH